MAKASPKKIPTSRSSKKALKKSRAAAAPASRAKPKAAKSLKTRKGAPSAKSTRTSFSKSAKTSDSAKTKISSVKNLSLKSPEPKTLGKPVKLHEVVSEFSIATTSHEDLSLSSLRGKKVVLYFYPKDSTPGCTTEGIEFNKLLPQFKKSNAEVFGVSRDNLKSHDKFRAKYEFQFD
ncbi:MAG: peroxiredoxin, partial [Bdellovibrionaceae bacterium]|nr:peroxiredoxin [Pseudobdellovibrionaceae bacterium]